LIELIDGNEKNDPQKSADHYRRDQTRCVVSSLPSRHDRSEAIVLAAVSDEKFSDDRSDDGQAATDAHPENKMANRRRDSKLYKRLKRAGSVEPKKVSQVWVDR